MTDPLADIGAILTARVRRAAQRQMVRALLGGLALLFLGVAIVAGVAAAGVALAARLGGLQACLIVAAAAFLVALVLAAASAHQGREARRIQQAELAELRRTIFAAKTIATDLTRGKALMVAAAVGVLVGLTATRHGPKDKG